MVNIDFILNKTEDGSLTVTLAPSVPIGGWSITYSMFRHFSMPITSGLVTKSMASGYYGVSGMNIIASGTGVLIVSLPPSDVSGLDPGAYCFRIARTDLGAATSLSEGVRIMSD